MRPHVLRIPTRVVEFDRLIAAVRQNMLRCGWLEWRPEAHEPLANLPSHLAEPAGLGVLRAVEVAASETVSVKPRRGPAVFSDVLREHFRGCALVLVHAPTLDGLPDLPSLTWTGTSWKVTATDGTSWQGSGEELAARLRKPKPW